MRLRSIAATGLRPSHGKTIRVRLESMQVVSDCAVAAVRHRSQKAPLESMRGPDQKGEQSHAENRLPASDPTSSFSALRCSKSSICTSSATSSSLYSESRCCIDRLRSPPGSSRWADIMLRGRYRPKADMLNGLAVYGRESPSRVTDEVKSVTTKTVTLLP